MRSKKLHRICKEKSFRDNLKGKTPSKWRKSMYYRYWMNADYDHNVIANYGIRTDRYKLIFLLW